MAKNFAYSLVATAPSPATSGTSLVVTAADGTKFPAVPFNATIWPVSSRPTTANAEIVTVTVVSTDTLTITRAQEGSSARTVIIGDQIAATVTANIAVQINKFIPQSASNQNIVLDASTDFATDDTVEVGGSYSLEVPATSTLEVFGFTRSVNLRNDQFYNPYKFHVHLVAAANTGNSAFALVPFDTKGYDTSSNIDVTSNKGRFTAPITGYYHFSARVSVTSGSIMIVALYKNGAEASRGADMRYTAAAAGATVADDLFLSVGQYVEVFSFGNVANALDVSTTALNYFSGHLISAT